MIWSFLLLFFNGMYPSMKREENDERESLIYHVNHSFQFGERKWEGKLTKMTNLSFINVILAIEQGYNGNFILKNYFLLLLFYYLCFLFFLLSFPTTVQISGLKNKHHQPPFFLGPIFSSQTWCESE